MKSLKNEKDKRKYIVIRPNEVLLCYTNRLTNTPILLRLLTSAIFSAGLVMNFSSWTVIFSKLCLLKSSAIKEIRGTIVLQFSKSPFGKIIYPLLTKFFQNTMKGLFYKIIKNSHLYIDNFCILTIDSKKLSKFLVKKVS